MKRIAIIVLVFAAFSGFALRSVELINRNYLFVYDQGLDMMAARSIAVDHKLTLIGSAAGAGFAGLPGIFHGPGYHYLLALVSFVFRGDPYWVMVLLWLLQAASVYVLYRILKRQTDSISALSAVFVAAVSPALIGMTRVIWAPNSAGFFITLYLFVLLSMHHRTVFRAFILGLSAASLYHFELPFAAVALVSSALYLIFAEGRRSFGSIASFLCGAVTGLVPLILFDARHGWQMFGGVLKLITNPVQLKDTTPFDFAGNFRTFLHAANSVFPPIPGLPLWFLPVLFVVSGLYLRKTLRGRSEHRLFYGLIIIIAVHLVLFVPYRNPVYGHYLTVLTYVFVLLSGMTAGALFRNRWGDFVWFAGFALSIAALFLYPVTVRNDLADYGGTAKIRGKIDAIEAVYDMAGGRPFNLFVFSPPVYTYPYEYVLQWHAKPKYGYLPGTEKSGTGILLIEPDPDKPWSYKGWLETVIIDGKTTETVTLPGGFIIQKRLFDTNE